MRTTTELAELYESMAINSDAAAVDIGGLLSQYGADMRVRLMQRLEILKADAQVLRRQAQCLRSRVGDSRERSAS
jgi:hypothetical protein